MGITLGAQIKKYRELEKLSQKDLAKKLGKGQSAISHYEADRRIPDIATLSKMAKIFNISMDELIRARNATAHGLGFNVEELDLIDDVHSAARQITPEDLTSKYELLVEGKPASKEEIEIAIKYIEALRIMSSK